MSNFLQDFVTIDKAKISYYRCGSSRRKKQSLIMLHGVSDSALCWTRVADVLCKRYDVILVDALGHGLSGRTGKDFTWETHAKQLAGLIKKLKLEKPVVMGHSMGAGTAADLAAAYPALLKAIILEDPPWSDIAPHPQNAEEAKKMHQEFLTMFAHLKKLRLQDIVIESRKMDPAWAEEERLPWATAKKQFDTGILNSVVVNPHPYDEIVVKIKCPTLLITAEKGVVSRETAEKIGKLWKAKAPYKWVRIKGAGHNIRRENFQDYMKAAEGFLEEIGV